ncbi:hypothetical protein [Arachnia propionica]|uniref:Uncharacterized protein n=1 Tax=Arachnia propionica TaxID=1750 RepID=A0A448MZQ5_9ACTN|nr:hypothetical protein [Arachnia propionica]VEH70621.1 Uncharacterised protein [Arachnia propionica]
MYLVMLETNGNQHYIFSSPRLRENIGASAQLVCLKEWTDKALNETGANTAWEQNAAAHLTSTRVSRVNDDDVSDLNFITEHTEWVSRASGKVIFMVKTETCAKAVIGQVTRTALAQAPGIDVSGVYISMNDQSAVDEDLLKKVHAEAAAYALRRSPAQARFSQMPFLARAKDSSLPAAPPLSCMLPGGLKDEAADDLATAHSLPSRIKRYRAYWARKGLIDLVTDTNTALKEEKDQDRLVPDPTKLREKLERAFSIGKEDWPANTSVPRNPDDSANAPADTSEQSAQQETKPEEDLERAEEALSAIEYPFQDGRTGKDNRDTHPTAAQRSITSPGPIALSKVAVIHIDGNGIGAIMRNLKAAVGCVPSDEFEGQLGCEPRDPDALRRFVLTVSLHLDAVVADAFATAWYDVARWAQKDRRAEQIDFTVVPVVPVILGGDDVTVIASGDYALPFAASFLLNFEKKTAADPLLKYLHAVSKICDKKGISGPAPMTAAAGVAIVRRNFPFHIAYELAEKLVSRAKGVGKNQGCSTLDFHVLFDTTVVDPDDQLGGYRDFTKRPFRLIKRTSDSEAQTPTETPFSGPSGTSETPAPATWKDTCRRVARFKGFQHTEDEKDRVEPFPRTRAARIRKLLSDGKQEEVVKHWEAVKKEVSVDSDIARGGSESLFDLLELADLLPNSYLQQVTGLAHPKDSTPTTPTSEEVHS